MTRRKFGQLLTTSAACAIIPTSDSKEVPPPLRFGMIADIHHGLADQAGERLNTFMKSLKSTPVDFVIQLGDFCFGDSESQSFLNEWNQIKAPRYHILGNHDMDKTTKKEMVNFLGMSGPYYQFTCNGFRVIVLDCNNILLKDGKYIDYSHSNYFRYPEGRGYIDPDQLNWLEKALLESKEPVIIFTHQGLASGAGTKNQALVRSMVAKHNHNNSRSPVICFFAGHHHIDKLTFEDGVHHHWVNSASYHWVGNDYGRMAHYKDSLFAFVSIGNDNSIRIQGRQSEFVPPSPAERGYPKADIVTPHISDRIFKAVH